MARNLLSGTRLNEIWGSLSRQPAYRVLVWNPLQASIGEVVTGSAEVSPVDLTPFVDSVELTENIGFENFDDPSIPSAAFRFRRNAFHGQMRRGLIADGVIVRVFHGDRRVHPDDWLCVFTGTFRGRPGDNPGTRADESEGFAATAYGREERYLNQNVTTDQFPGPVDTGHIAYTVAWKHMGLGQDEILFGNQGFESRHITNQLVEMNALEAIYQCLFPVGKKPKFDALGRLTAVDVDLDKPASRIYSAGNMMVERRIAAPNDVEVANQVLIKGLSHILTKSVQEAQRLTSANRTTGFFEESVNDDVWFSDDKTQRAQNTFLVQKKKIRWSSADYTQVDEFHGSLEIDTHYLRNVRAILFGFWLVMEIIVAVLDYYTAVVTDLIVLALMLVLRLLKAAALAALIWAMNYIGTGVYEVYGEPYEYVYQEVISDSRMTGLDPEELRKVEYRNDFVSTFEVLDALGAQHLRRETVKNQLHEFGLVDDPLLEVDDVIELADGCRYYVVSIRKTLKRGGEPIMHVSCWKVFEDVLATAGSIRDGYGFNYARLYGEGL